MYTSPDKMQDTIEVPDGITVTKKKHMLGFAGPLGKTFKSFRKIAVGIELEDNGNKIRISAAGGRKRDYATLHTVRSLIRNICEGLLSGYTIKMKIVFAHFPITVKVQGGTILIENFQGERAARTTRIVGSTTKVEPKGDDVLITGAVWTDVTQTAANIELSTRVKGKDHRVFLDGIYVYEKSKGIE